MYKLLSLIIVLFMSININASDPINHSQIQSVQSTRLETSGMQNTFNASKNLRLDNALVKAVMRADLTAAKKLVSQGANVNATVGNGDCTIMSAAILSHRELYIYEFLISKGANVNRICKTSGDTALMQASKLPFTSPVDFFISHGANIDTQNNAGATALIFAAERGRTANVELLISKGANIHIKDFNGNTALNYAKRKNYVDIVKILRLHGARSR